MTSSSFVKSAVACGASTIRIVAMTAVTPTAIWIDLAAPLLARSSFSAPIFWLTKVVAAWLSELIGRKMKESSLL